MCSLCLLFCLLVSLFDSPTTKDDGGRANERERDHLPVAGGSDKVEKGVDTVVAEARVTLDPGLF